MNPSCLLSWRSKALGSAPLFFGQEVAQKQVIVKGLLEQ